MNNVLNIVPCKPHIEAGWVYVLIYVKFKSLGGISYKCFQKLYESDVEPILKYAAGIWGHKEYKIINTVQNNGAHFMLGVRKRLPT